MKKLKTILLSFSLILVFSLNITSLKAVTPTVTTSPTVTQAPTTQYTISIFTDKTTLKPGENFQITVSAKNTGTTTIENLEIRVPLYKTLSDIESINVNPSFNQIVNSGGFPIGFNDRSWIINSFSAGETKDFAIQYKLNSTIKTTNSVLSAFTLPASWNDPSGIPANTPQNLNTLRADIYLNNTYKNSFATNLPKAEALDTPISAIKLNDKYYFNGSKSTELKNITSSNIKSFPNFILETQDILIEWTNPIDFSDSEVATKLTTLDDNLSLDWGKIVFNPTQLKFLAKPAKITFKNINFANEPKIKVKDKVQTLTEAKANWQKTQQNIVLTATTLDNLALSPTIDVEQSVIETSERKVTISAKVADPNSKVSYSIDGQAKKEIHTIDLQKGNFEIIVENASQVKQVEIVSALNNGESTSKIVIIKYTGSEQSQIEPTSTPQIRLQSNLFDNPILATLVMVGIAMLLITFGYIYFLYYRRNKIKKSNLEIFEKEKEKTSSAFSVMKKPETPTNNESSINLTDFKVGENEKKSEFETNFVLPKVEKPEIINEKDSKKSTFLSSESEEEK